MLDLGTVRPGSTIRIPFSTFDKDDGSSITMTNFAAADILIYKDGSTTERASTAGFTATTDFDSKTGKHVAVIDLADNTTAGFYAAGSEYLVAIDSVTVDAVTVGSWIARFRIGYPNALLDTTIATLSSQTSFTLTAGPAEDDALNGHWVVIHDVASAVQMGKAIILDYTGSTKTVTLVAGTTFTAAAGDNISIMDLAPLQPTVTGRTLDVSAGGEAGIDWANVGTPSSTVSLSATTVATVTTTTTATNVTTVNGLAANVITAASAAADFGTEVGTAVWATAARTLTAATNVTSTGAAVPITAGGLVSADVTAISTDTTAANNCESFFDGTGYAGTNNVIPLVTTTTTATNVTTVNGLATGVITAAAIAADAIGASELAADAVAEIADAVWDEVLSGHLTAGSTGNALNAAGSAGDPWSTSLPGAYGAGSAGYIIGTNLNATVSSRAASSSLPTNFSALAITAGGIVQADLQTIKTQAVTCSGGVTIPAATLASTTNITAATGVTLTPTTGLGNQTANITGNLSGSVGSVSNVDNIWTFDISAGYPANSSALTLYTIGNNVDAPISGLPSAAAISTEVWGETTRTLTGTQAFNLAGNITGNLSGSVSSVTGAVGSVTGTIGGLSAAALADFFDTNSGTNYASAVAGSVVKEIADNAGGSGLTAGAIADAVWDEAISGHLTSGTTGAKLNSAAAAGDPLSNEVPGSYAGGTAGYVLGQIGSGTVTFSGPVIDDDDTFEVIQGDDYLIADSRSLNWTFGASPNLTGATVVMRIQTPTVTELTGTKSGEGTSAQLVKFEMTKTLTASFYVKSYAFDIQATLSDGSVITLARSTFLVRSQVA